MYLSLTIYLCADFRFARLFEHGSTAHSLFCIYPLVCFYIFVFLILRRWMVCKGLGVTCFLLQFYEWIRRNLAHFDRVEGRFYRFAIVVNFIFSHLFDLIFELFWVGHLAPNLSKNFIELGILFAPLLQICTVRFVCMPSHKFLYQYFRNSVSIFGKISWWALRLNIIVMLRFATFFPHFRFGLFA